MDLAVRTVPTIHAVGTRVWHFQMALANGPYPMHHEISRRKHPQATRRQRGRAVAQTGVTDPRSLTPRASRVSRRLRGGAAIATHRTRPLPLCARVRHMNAYQRRDPLASRRQPEPQIHCGIPQKHRWAGAATPTQRNATHRPQVSPGKASDMINGTNLLGKHNPQWPNGNTTETTNILVVAPPRLTAPRRKLIRFPGIPRIPVIPAGPALRTSCGALGSRLSGIPRRIGARLFAANDAEARWRGWQVTQLHGGLARSYRDPRFNALQALREAAAQLADQTCANCPKDQGGQLS
jgi:hypothetical protein